MDRYDSWHYPFQIIGGLESELNRLYSMFCERHPYFEANNGEVSVCAHSLGVVIMYDILTGWDPIELYDQYVSRLVVCIQKPTLLKCFLLNRVLVLDCLLVLIWIYRTATPNVKQTETLPTSQIDGNYIETEIIPRSRSLVCIRMQTIDRGSELNSTRTLTLTFQLNSVLFHCSYGYESQALCIWKRTRFNL